MSRVGKKPVVVPDGVEFHVNGQDVKAKGKLGELALRVHEEVSVKVEDVANDEGKTFKQIVLNPATQSPMAQKVWPTMRMLVNNIIEGVTKGYSKKLLIQGVGYRANLQGKDLVLSLGFSHEVRHKVPEGIQIKVENQTEIQITGIDKQKVGQVAANIRGYRPPEPYKGKGIRYADEKVRRKEGKKK